MPQRALSINHRLKKYDRPIARSGHEDAWFRKMSGLTHLLECWHGCEIVLDHLPFSRANHPLACRDEEPSDERLSLAFKEVHVLLADHEDEASNLATLVRVRQHDREVVRLSRMDLLRDHHVDAESEQLREHFFVRQIRQLAYEVEPHRISHIQQLFVEVLGEFGVRRVFRLVFVVAGEAERVGAVAVWLFAVPPSNFRHVIHELRRHLGEGRYPSSLFIRHHGDDERELMELGAVSEAGGREQGFIDKVKQWTPHLSETTCSRTGVTLYVLFNSVNKSPNS